MDSPKQLWKTKVLKDKKKRDFKPMFKKKQQQQVFTREPKKSELEKNEITSLQQRIPELVRMKWDEVESFDILPLSKNTLKWLKKHRFMVPTKVQRQSLIYSLRGLDVVAAAKTGSGKTLAFVIPMLESLYIKKWTRVDGLGALIITPVRELAYQIFSVLNKVGKGHEFSVGLIIGGKDLQYEWSLVHRCNILVCTPGRLLQHMTENPDFDATNIQMLILDEADQCLSMGFADTMNYILEELPKERQTLLFSATQTKDLTDLVRAGCNNPVFCSAHEHSDTKTPKSLQESYVVCETHDKFHFLWSFIKYHNKQKILVFFATCKQVQYMYNIFCKLRPGLSVMGLHGGMHQLRRMAIYDDFCGKKRAVLFATDVAARGLDIPAVHWVLQLDCPEDVTSYIHRAGRTARYSHTGHSLLVLTSSEEKAMVDNLSAKNISINRIEVNPNKVQSVHVSVEMILTEYNNLKEDAVRAFKSYLKSIALMKDKKVFDVTTINLDIFARSLGLGVTPRIRFLEKKLKQKYGTCKATAGQQLQHQKPLHTTLKFNAGDSDDNDDDFLSSARDQSKYLGNKQESEEANPMPDPTLNANTTNKKAKKVVTKAAVAKKLAKMNLQINTRIRFSEDGEQMLVSRKMQESEAAKQETMQEGGGINIEKLKEIMMDEDRIDKKLHAEKEKLKKKQKKQKAKKKKREEEDEEEEDEEEEDEEEEESEDDDMLQTIIDELPDPDKIYGPLEDHDNDKKGKSEGDCNDEGEEEEDQNEEEECESSSEESEAENKETPEPKVSGKRRARERAREAKRARLAQSNNLQTLPVDEQEQLALFLLRGRT